MSFTKGKDEKESMSSSTSKVCSAGNMEAFLGKGSKVVGRLEFTGPVELDGYVEGELDSKEPLTIGESAVINAKVSGGVVLVKGTVNGDIVASERLCLQKPAKVVGNISSTCVSIEEGVVFEGSCVMEKTGSSYVHKNDTKDNASKSEGATV